jgi:hypothetical protein
MSERIEELQEEARYRRERLQLYRARHYAGRALDRSRLAELQRSYDGAAARLARAKAAARPPPPA